jgi:hypothetical protein
MAFCFQKLPWKYIFFPIILPAHCFLWIWRLLVNLLAWLFVKMPPNLPDYGWFTSRRKGKAVMVFATVYNLDEKLNNMTENSVFFDTDKTFVICDNSANTHICNDKSKFTHYRELTDGKMTMAHSKALENQIYQRQQEVSSLKSSNQKAEYISIILWPFAIKCAED